MFAGNSARTDPTPTVHAPARLRLFNVKYSPNLGDGLLSECLEHALLACGAGTALSMDLAARTAYSSGSSARGMLIRGLALLPAALRQPTVRLALWALTQRTLKPQYREALTDCDAVIIGGGNLLADLDLNFPTKVSLAIESAARRKLPVYLYGVGVAEGWSKRGQKLLHNAVRTGAVRQVFVRDERSRQAWNALAGDAFSLPAQIVRDPGLLASLRYDVRPLPSSRCIGLNLMSALAVTYHGGPSLTQDALDAWYLGLARSLMEQGWSLAVFSNGSPEDREMVIRLRPRFAALPTTGTSIAFPEVATPTELVSCIAPLDGLVAFRMHAIIAAYSCKVPFLALAWDRKLASFVESVSCENWLAEIANTSPELAATRIAEAIAQGVDPARHEAVLNEAQQDVSRLFQSLRSAPGNGAQ